MAGNHLGAFSLHAQELQGAGADIAVRGSVETIAAYAVLLVQLVGNGIHISLGRHGLVESGIKDTYLRQTGHELFHCIDTLQVGRVVQRSQVRALLEGLEHLVG